MAWFIVQSLIILVPAFALGIVVGWLVWARRPADPGVRAELATCTCDTVDDLDVDADDGADADPPSEETDVDLDAQDVDVEDLVAAYEAEEADDDDDGDADGDSVSADGSVEADADPDDDVAALAVAVGALNGPADDEPDDIERIEGVGPKIGRALRAAGLDTYAAVADASQEALREALRAGGVKSVPKNVESWPSQARLLADGAVAGQAEG
ncbi:MAG: helix-hairpin-helix domain-containing protein [Micrococcales bacterium]|nr:helix-hairpin-helix domain-containing protein [Micrococcales bacterium]